MKIYKAVAPCSIVLFVMLNIQSLHSGKTNKTGLIHDTVLFRNGHILQKYIFLLDNATSPS